MVPEAAAGTAAVALHQIVHQTMTVEAAAVLDLYMMELTLYLKIMQ